MVRGYEWVGGWWSELVVVQQTEEKADVAHGPPSPVAPAAAAAPGAAPARGWPDAPVRPSTETYDHFSCFVQDKIPSPFLLQGVLKKRGGGKGK